MRQEAHGAQPVVDGDDDDVAPVGEPPRIVDPGAAVDECTTVQTSAIRRRSDRTGTPSEPSGVRFARPFPSVARVTYTPNLTPVKFTAAPAMRSPNCPRRRWMTPPRSWPIRRPMPMTHDYM